MRNFAGDGLTFQKLGSASVGFGGCARNFSWKPRVAKSFAFQFWPLAKSSMHAMINPCIVFWPILCAYWWWGQSGWGPLERVQIF